MKAFGITIISLALTTAVIDQHTGHADGGQCHSAACQTEPLRTGRFTQLRYGDERYQQQQTHQVLV